MIHGILLAAGASRRFGAEKLLQPLADGRPLVLAALAALREGVDACFAVVRENDAELARLLAGAGARVVACREAERGMGHSLACGVAASLDAGGEAVAGWVVALADMPALPASAVREVAQALRDGARIAAPVHDGRRGHPVGFAAALRDELLALDGDRGGRDILARHAGEVRPVPCADPGVLVDVDTPDDLARLLKQSVSNSPH